MTLLIDFGASRKNIYKLYAYLKTTVVPAWQHVSGNSRMRREMLIKHNKLHVLCAFKFCEFVNLWIIFKEVKFNKYSKGHSCK